MIKPFSYQVKKVCKDFVLYLGIQIFVMKKLDFIYKSDKFYSKITRYELLRGGGGGHLGITP